MTEVIVAVVLGAWAVFFAVRLLRRRGKGPSCSCGDWARRGRKDGD
ncbi:MAG: hypothetical protein GXY38_08355 [Planctomycetes bacterium]|nr:hypothetical protein [Planctomycetota bacterium]